MLAKKGLHAYDFDKQKWRCGLQLRRVNQLIASQEVRDS